MRLRSTVLLTTVVCLAVARSAQPENSAQALFQMAIDAAAHKDYRLALQTLKRLPADYPDPYTHGYDEALAAYDAGDTVQATTLIRDMVSRGLKSADLYDLLGNALEKQGIAAKQPALVKQAYDSYRNGIFADPHDLDNFIDIGHLALSLGNYDLCEQLLSEGLQQNTQAWQLLVQRGIAYALTSKTEKAAADFARARQLAPNSPMPYLASAMLDIQQGHNANAASTLQSAIERTNQANAWLYFLLARSLYREGLEDTASLARMRNALETAIRLDPNFTDAFALAGHVWMKFGHTAKAVRFFERAHQLAPENSQYVYALAVARRSQGDSQAAAKEFRVFRQLEAKNNAAQARQFFMKIFVAQIQ